MNTNNDIGLDHLYRKNSYLYGGEIYTPTKLDKLMYEEGSKNQKEMMEISIMFENISSIFSKAGERALASKFRKIAYIYYQLSKNYYIHDRDKKQAKANKMINKNKKNLGHDCNARMFCREFDKLIKETFVDIGSLYEKLPTFNYTVTHYMLLNYGQDNFTKEECIAIANNFKRKCKNKPIFKTELTNIERVRGL